MKEYDLTWTTSPCVYAMCTLFVVCVLLSFGLNWCWDSIHSTDRGNFKKRELRLNFLAFRRNSPLANHIIWCTHSWRWHGCIEHVSLYRPSSPLLSCASLGQGTFLLFLTSTEVMPISIANNWNGTPRILMMSLECQWMLIFWLLLFLLMCSLSCLPLTIIRHPYESFLLIASCRTPYHRDEKCWREINKAQLKKQHHHNHAH